MAHLRAEIQRLQQKVQQLAQASQEMAWLRAQNQQLQQELQEAKRNQWNQFLPKFKTDFHIQVHATGKTGGCEKEFLKKVSEGLSKIHLKPERYQEGSGHFLLVFCPVASRMGTDMENALEGLQGEPKAVLVVMHHISKECNLFVDTKVKAHHPAVVCTVHVRFTIQEGFYACPMNEEAVANVAEVLEEHIKAGKRDLAISGAPSKSQNL
ncbi:uncharacterized protein LOC134295697 [Anolis carolinensis]|uniref:uncharacterized protein LOC134295697 n=1 Tax=Anolis carolinensis TaxID=28377 RepID=UPI002F2B3D23